METPRADARDRRDFGTDLPVKVAKTSGVKKEDLPEAPAWFDKVLLSLNSFMSTVSTALEGRLTTENFLECVEPLTFTTSAAAASTFPLKLKNKLLGGAKPIELRVAQIYKRNGVIMSAAYSREWVTNSKGEIELTFHGLENSTDYIATVIYRA